MTASIKTGLIGHPVAHSLSPLIHNYWIAHYGLCGVYKNIDVLPQDLEGVITKMVEQGYAGFNVTLPYKQAVMTFCDSIDDVAQKIGAVNTVVIGKEGTLRGLRGLRGLNTDSFGFVENILQAGNTDVLKDSTALVLGAGGAARAVIYGLLSIGVRTIKIANRTREKAENIAECFPVELETVAWERRALAARNASILVNTTALGMEGQPELAFDLRHLPQSATVCDIVYKPLETALLKRAAARGNPVVTGIGMLLHQARPAFWEWFGTMPEITEELQQKTKEKI